MAEAQGRDFRAPPVIHVGRGALNQLPAALRELRAERAAIITDRVMGGTEWTPRLEALAADADVSYPRYWPNSPANPRRVMLTPRWPPSVRLTPTW